MNKIKVSEIGEVDLTSIEALSYDELKAWIELRLHGKDTQIPSDFRQGDTPYYIISLLYPKLSRHLREDIHRIVGEFAKDMARNPDTTWKGEAGHQLLLLISSICVEETRRFLLEMAESRQFFVQDVLSLAEDLHLRVLQTLVSLRYRASPEFWDKQYLLAPERYGKIVFNGLALISPEQAICFMASIDSVELVDRILWMTFPSLLNDWGIARIVRLIEEYLPQMKPEVRQAVMTFFKEEGYTLQEVLHKIPPEGHALAGLLLCEKKWFTLAQTYFEQALPSPAGCFGLGLLKLHEKKFTQAKLYFEQVKASDSPFALKGEEALLLMERLQTISQKSVAGHTPSPKGVELRKDLKRLRADLTRLLANKLEPGLAC